MLSFLKLSHVEASWVLSHLLVTMTLPKPQSGSPWTWFGCKKQAKLQSHPFTFHSPSTTMYPSFGTVLKTILIPSNSCKSHCHWVMVPTVLRIEHVDLIMPFHRYARYAKIRATPIPKRSPCSLQVQGWTKGDPPHQKRQGRNMGSRQLIVHSYTYDIPLHNGLTHVLILHIISLFVWIHLGKYII